MESIADVLKKTDLRGVLERAQEPVRKYDKKDTKIYQPEYARFKMKAYFLDGNAKVFYSYDNVKNMQTGKTLKDEWSGLQKLVRLTQKYAGKFKSIVIWATVNAEPRIEDSKYDLEVIKWTQFGMKTNANVAFTTDGRMKYRPA